MKSHLKICLTTFALMFFFGAFSVVEAQSGLKKVLKKMASQHRSLKSLEANLKLEKFNFQLQETDITTGFFKYIPQHRSNDRKRYLRIDWTRPVEEQLSFIGDEVLFYRPRLKQVYTANAFAGGEVAKHLAILKMSVAEIKAEYRLKYLGKKKMSNGIKFRQIELTPKTSKKFRHAFVWIDKNGLPMIVQVVEHNGDWTKISFSDIKQNRPLQMQFFTILYPKNIKPIRG